MGSIVAAFEFGEKAVNWINNGGLERWGSAIRRADTNGKKVIGHLETVKKTTASPKLLTTTGQTTGQIATQLAGNTAGMSEQLLKKSSKLLGGITSLGWANLAVSGISIGVTAVSTAIIAKKINALSAEVAQINQKVDSIMEEIQAIRTDINDLKINEIRKLYRDIDEQIAYMQHLMNKLNTESYNEYTVGETEKSLIKASRYLNDLLGRYNDNSSISLGLDIIMAHFYAFVSLLKTYMSVVYLNEGIRKYGLEYDSILRIMCTKSMVESIQNMYRQSSAVTSFVSPKDIGLITSVYKGIMIEQISEVKSQRGIIEIVDYNEYKRINEKLLYASASDEIAFIRYA